MRSSNCRPASGDHHELAGIPGEAPMEIVARFASETTIAAALTGCFARTDADRYSDIDLLLFDDGLPPGKSPIERLIVQKGQMVSLTTATTAFWREHFEWPGAAIYTVPAFRNLVPLFDRNGALAALIEQARSFSWEPLQSAADEFVREKIVQQAEVVHKVLSSFERGDPERLATYTWELTTEMSLAIAVHRRIFIESGNYTFDAVCRAQGSDSDWTRAHRRATGAGAGLDGKTSMADRGRGALQLYRETATASEGVLHTPDSEVVHHAVMNLSTFLFQGDG